MAVKILCLHGMGVSAEVFETQSASFRALLPSDYVFDFVNAEKLCDPSPGAEDFFDGPYRCWYTSPSTQQVTDAHAVLDGILASKGPYDLIMGFSQGAALTASYLLHHQQDGKPSPVKAALFICSPLPFSKTTSNGLDCREYFSVPSDEPLPTPRPTAVPRYLIPESYFLRSDHSASGSEEDKALPRVDSAASLVSGFAAESGQQAQEQKVFYNMFHPTSDDIRLSLPTAHVYGLKDSWQKHSLDLVKLCSNVSTFQHDGGHEIPRVASEEICDLFEDLVFRAAIY